MAAVLSPLLFDEPAVPSAPGPSTGDRADPVAREAAAAAEAKAAARRAAFARLRQGRLGTIATSARGILGPGQSAVERRSLLGG